MSHLDFTVQDFADTIFVPVPQPKKETTLILKEEKKGQESEETPQQIPANSDGTNSNYWEHLAGWLAHKDDPNVLFLFFEDLKNHLPTVVEKVADFMGIPLDEELKSCVVLQSNFDFMREHATQFDDHWMAQRSYLRRHGRVPDENPVGKVRAGGGKVGGKLLPKELQARLQARWEEIIGPFGFENYEALLEKYRIR